MLKHSAAMELLQAGVDCSVIALWLGHESIETTQTYLHAHLALKEAALAKLKPYLPGKRTDARVFRSARRPFRARGVRLFKLLPQTLSRPRI